MRRRILITILLLSISIIMASCSIINISKPYNSSTNSTAPNDEFTYANEKDFYKSLKSGNLGKLLKSKDINYFWTPQQLPFGAELLFINADKDYIIYHYKYISKDEDYPYEDNKLTLIWYLRNDTDNYVKDLKNLGNSIISDIGFDSSIICLAKSDYPGKSTDEKSKGVWSCFYTQSDGCFEGKIPEVFERERICDILIMEKVLIEQ